jgi:ribonuclease E
LIDRKMIINAIHAEECRIAISEDNKLVELEIEVDANKKLKGNIYKGVVTRVEPSLQAAFIDFGAERNGFLQINDINLNIFNSTNSGEKSAPEKRRQNVNIRDILHTGQELIVQVIKEERELKGSTLTTFISLPGRYIVLTAGNERGGVSRKIIDSDQRQRLKELVDEFSLPAGLSLIIRTAGLDRSQSDLSRDLSLQLKIWERLMKSAEGARAPSILYKESELATRVIRDYFTPDIREIVVDHEPTYQKVKEFVGEVMPRYRSRVVLHKSTEPIFSLYKLDEQIDQIYSEEVKLPSGGAIIIESLEALVAIDVNSGRSTNETGIEETALRTNLEATIEIARHLKLRDLGGLIVIDFIDMSDHSHRLTVENALKSAVKGDKARIEIGKVSKFGLLEMSRQRIKSSLVSQNYTKCPNCKGTGIIKNPESTALEALRKVHSAVSVGGINSVKVRLSPTAALYLLNVKKKFLVDLEESYSTQISIVADGRLKSEDYEFEINTAKASAEKYQKELEEVTPKAAANNSSHRRNIPPRKGRRKVRSKLVKTVINATTIKEKDIES